MKYHVLTSGYVSLDRIIKIKSPLKVGFTSIVENRDNAQTYFGGCSTNIAYLLARLGFKTLPIARFGEDHAETGFIEFLKKGGVCLEGVDIVPGESTSNCYLISGEDDNHVTIFYPGAMAGKYARPIKDEYFENARLGVLTVGSQEDNLEFYQQCKKSNLPLVFGMKCDFDAFPKDFFQEVLFYSRIIFTNQTEREEIEKVFQLESITDLFSLGRAEVIVTTLGAQGSIYYYQTEAGLIQAGIPAAKFGKVVDTTGTGDAFIAGFLYGYLNGKEIGECCRMGSVLASFIIEDVGSCTNAPDEKSFLDRYQQFLTREEDK